MLPPFGDRSVLEAHERGTVHLELSAGPGCTEQVAGVLPRSTKWAARRSLCSTVRRTSTRRPSQASSLHHEISSRPMDPAGRFVGVSRVTTTAAEARVAQAQDLRELYAASYARLVGIVGAVSGDRHEAEEAVQDGWAHGRRSRGTTTRRRGSARSRCARSATAAGKALNGIRAALRHGPPANVPGPTPAAVDAERALAALPEQQRAVVVLHRVGLDAPAIADALGVPVGTVTSRLARARAALAPMLREDRHDA